MAAILQAGERRRPTSSRRVEPQLVSVRLVLDGRGDPVMVVAQVAFHLAAGIDDLVVRVPSSAEDVADALGPLLERGVVSIAGDEPAPTGSGWSISAAPGEFWWPSGGALDEVLSLVPDRFGVVHGVVRQFLTRPEDGRHFAERDIARPGLAPSSGHLPPARAAIARIECLRFRESESKFGPALRGWYPIEVLNLCGNGPVLRSGDDDLDKAAADGAIVVDTRVRDALRTLADDAVLAPGETTYDPTSTLTFPPRGLAEEAAIVRELQAVLGDELPASVDDRFGELDRRVRSLEQGLLGRARRAVAAERDGP